MSAADIPDDAVSELEAQVLAALRQGGRGR
jgi:hypothetical protein